MKILRNKNKIIALVLAVMVFVINCGFVNLSVATTETSSEETTEDTVYVPEVIYYDSEWVSTLGELRGGDFIEYPYTKDNVLLYVNQEHNDLYSLYSNTITPFAFSNSSIGPYDEDIINDFPVYLPDIVGNPFTVENCRFQVGFGGRNDGSYRVVLLYSLGDICNVWYGGSEYFISTAPMYIVEYHVNISYDENGNAIYTCDVPKTMSYISTSYQCVSGDTEHVYYQREYKMVYAPLKYSMIYSDYPIYQGHERKNLQTYVDSAIESDLGVDDIVAEHLYNLDTALGYLAFDLRPYFYDFSDKLPDSGTDTVENNSHHMAFDTFDMNLVSNGTYNTSRLYQTYTYDEWIKDNIVNYKLVTEVNVSASTLKGRWIYDSEGNNITPVDTCNFSCIFEKDLSTVSSSNTIFLSEIFTNCVNSSGVGFFEYYQSLTYGDGERDLSRVQSDLYDVIECYFSGNALKNPTGYLDFNTFGYGLEITFNVYLETFGDGQTYKSNSTKKHYDIVNRSQTDVSTDITTNNNPWTGGSGGSDVNGALSGVTNTVTNLIESGAVSIGDVLASIGDVQGGNASISEGAISIVIDNANNNVNATLDIGINNDDVVNSANDVSDSIGDLLALLLLFKQNSFLDVVNLVFGFLPAAVIQTMSATIITICAMALIKFAKK